MANWYLVLQEKFLEGHLVL